MFKDAILSALTNETERKSAIRCIQDELIVKYNRSKATPLPDENFSHKFEYVSAGYHPGIAVVDINQDGWDDLYVMSRWGKNQLYINTGSGQFKEKAKDFGLDIAHHCTSANFADYDNDGDPDLFIGRSAERSLYLVNNEGKFVDRSYSSVNGLLPAMVSSISSADYNNDGLLDIYFSTYGIDRSLLVAFLSEDERWEFNMRSTKATNKFIDAVGAPNVLLVNIGNGKFTRAQESEQLQFWQPTLQSSWSDFDQDGDQDLYLANDFGPDRLLRNDYPEGFTEVTETIGHETMTGFGMGATWGDYDLDGKRDLYVSNMYSKAGTRITKKIQGLDQRFSSFASGNRLYRQSNNSFLHTSGTQPPQLNVTQAGWSWGGQFMDLNNDGFQDIYVTSGYFTAPAELEFQDDY